MKPWSDPQHPAECGRVDLWSQQGVEAGGSEVQSHSQLHNELQARLGYMGPYQNKQTNKETGETERWQFRGLAVLAEHRGLISSTHMMLHNRP